MMICRYYQNNKCWPAFKYPFLTLKNQIKTNGISIMFQFIYCAILQDCFAIYFVRFSLTNKYRFLANIRRLEWWRWGWQMCNIWIRIYSFHSHIDPMWDRWTCLQPIDSATERQFWWGMCMRLSLPLGVCELFLNNYFSDQNHLDYWVCR